MRFLAEGTSTAMLWFVIDDLLAALCTEPLPPNPPLTLYARKRRAVNRTKKITASLRRLLEASLGL